MSGFVAGLYRILTLPNALKWSQNHSLPAIIISDLPGANTALLMDRFAAALGFPEYFGRNWDALFDLLCDLDRGRVLIVLEARNGDFDPALLELLRDLVDDGSQTLMFGLIGNVPSLPVLC